MRRSGLALGGFCAVSAALSSSAMAQDGGMRIIFGLENRLEISRNERLSVPAAGTDIREVTRLSFGLSSIREIDRLDFTASGALIAENGTDGPGTEYVVLAEEFFRVLMGFRMVFAGEIEVDIRDLVAVETEEDGKRNVVAVL